MRLPKGFEEDYQTMRTRLRWAVRRGDDMDMKHAQMTAEEVAEFLRRWDGKIAVPEVQIELSKVQGWVALMRRHLDKIFLTQLLEVLETRREWQLSELFLKASTAFIRIMKQAPARLLPQLEEIYRSHTGYDYDPTVEYCTSEAQAEQCEEVYKKALIQLEVDWSERFTADLQKRLTESDSAQIQLWMREVQQSMDSLDKEPGT
ncbi:MAG: hypothetical protein JWL90_1481 [Chthoniobacteraceae bacterium]|nr:hypothetical protein [Chthoniobacteraceae bacterium]